MNTALLLAAILSALLGWQSPAPPKAAPPNPPPSDPPATSPSKKIAPPAPEASAKVRRWTIEGVERSAIVHTPGTKPQAGAPVIFVFHGHGGTALNAERGFRIQDHWPEAVVVYAQGIATKTRIDPEGKRPGWQLQSGDGEDRDLKFFDAMLASLKTEGWVDPARVYVTGHSNGGAFTYLLAAMRRDVLAAAAPSSAGTLELASVKPIPMMHVAGRKDKIVPFQGQERMMKFMRDVNKCAVESTDWAEGCKCYASSVDAPFVQLVHDGGHEFLRSAPVLMVKFFKEHSRPTEPPKDGGKPKTAPDAKPVPNVGTTAPDSSGGTPKQ